MKERYRLGTGMAVVRHIAVIGPSKKIWATYRDYDKGHILILGIGMLCPIVWIFNGESDGQQIRTDDAAVESVGHAMYGKSPW